MEINEHCEHGYASKGVAGTALGTGIAGTALGVGNAVVEIVQALSNNRRANGADLASVITPAAVAAIMSGVQGNAWKCSEDHCVNRYELGHSMELAAKDSEIALLRAEKDTDGKMLELYRYIDGKLNTIEARFGEQDVKNQATKDSILMVQQQCVNDKRELECAIKREEETRRCNDNLIVTYLNATFYPKMVADVTTGTTTTQATLYNPLPVCSC